MLELHQATCNIISVLVTPNYNGYGVVLISPLYRAPKPDGLDPRHSFTTRLLYTVVPSTWYAKDDATIDALHQCLADDMGDLFHHGVSVKVQWQKTYSIFLNPL